MKVCPQDALGKLSLTTDLWSDKNLSPFMAVTTHWIEARLKETPEGPQYELKLRSELVGFHRVPGRHDGEHLAQAFLYVIDRLSITSKVSLILYHIEWPFILTLRLDWVDYFRQCLQ